jgi:kynurenine formamidase
VKATIKIKNKSLEIDLSKPLDISIPLRASSKNPNAWYINSPTISPVQLDDWVGKVSKGASVNFNNIFFNPHAHGTHTECVGHISEDFNSVNKALNEFFFEAEVISITPQKVAQDFILTKEEIQAQLKGNTPEAIVIRTMPNAASKKTQKYSNTNWPYLTEAAAIFLREIGVCHLLIDLPSVDKEKDDGKLLAHKAFWNYPNATRHHATITEFIYVPKNIKDGSYLLNLQTAPFENDATPSRPVLFKLL